VTAPSRCPICNTPVTPPAPAPPVSPPAKSYFPFCSERCKQVDLGRWLTGQYAIPGESQIEDEVAEPPPPVKDPDEPE
jgi:uncharacterized protein